MAYSEAELQTLNEQLAVEIPKNIIKKSFELFDSIAISFSGAEDVVLIDMAMKLNPNAKIFSLDTGRLHPETYQFMEKVREHYNTEIEVLYPDAETLQAFVQKNGLFSFYKDDHKPCCTIRKTAPLRKKLETIDAWITGQRKDQSPGTRSGIPTVQADEVFSGEGRQLVKFNPLANWSSQQVWEYIQMFDVPFNSLHEKGFISIGCEPCTRPVKPNQHEREGRWWWEESTQKECGLHALNLPSD
ncbi:MAG: phosphoadenylyl-sulfate reductase [Pseudomonadales bacterium]|nr:phosphoadenylyl-sulfate reductase [Pseudomonadales bacterium]